MNKKISSFLAKETFGDSFKTYKYCFEKVDVPTLVYDDTQDICFKKYGETDHFKGYKDLSNKAILYSSHRPLFRFFLDGSRRTYKVDDIAYNNRIYPVIAGQIGVGCCERFSPHDIKSKKSHRCNVIALPDCADKDGKGDLFFNNLTKKLNRHPSLVSKGIEISKILNYADIDDSSKYEDKGIAKIQDEMIDDEKNIVIELVKEKALNEDAYLIKDGSLEYASIKTNDPKDLSTIKNNYRRVVGVSKSFNPERCQDERGKSNATRIANLPLYNRTAVYEYASSRTGDVKFGIWYIRIRDAKYSHSPFAGIIKVQKIMVTDNENENGLDSAEIDAISANLINERNPVCYGSDNRWANHLYPIYLTERFIKSQYLSDSFFLNLF
jgi:hypothetical protein